MASPSMIIYFKDMRSEKRGFVPLHDRWAPVSRVKWCLSINLGGDWSKDNIVIRWDCGGGNLSIPDNANEPGDDGVPFDWAEVCEANEVLGFYRKQVAPTEN